MLKRVSLGWILVSSSLVAPVMASDATTAPAAATAAATGSGGAREPIQFSATALSDCLSYFTDISGVNIVVDWKALEAAGIARDTPITLKLGPTVSLGKTLKLVLQQAGGAGVLTSYVDDGVLQITTQAAEDKLLVTRVYPIQDLLFQPTDATDAPNLQLSSVQSQQAGGGGGGGGGQSNIFSGTGNNNTNTARTQTDSANSIIKLITDTVRPETWVINGGTGTIDFFRGNLIVHAPRSVQQQLASQYMTMAR